MTDARDKMQEQANNYLADSRLRIKEWEAEQADLSTKHDDALKDSQTKLKEASEQSDRLDKKLSDANDKIKKLEGHLQYMEHDRGEPANDGHTETEEDNKRILKLKAQCKYWQTQLEQNKADTTARISKALATAKENSDKAAERRKEIADVQVGEIKQLKVALEKKEDEFNLVKKQSADEISALKEALAKKKEDDRPASSFNPAATVFTPSPATSSHPTLPSSPHTSVPATPFSPSPSAASFSPSPSPNPTTIHQQTPIKKEPMPEHARRNLAEINRGLNEKRRREMMGKSAEDTKAKPLSEEELGKSM